jgi:hypothetical protein
VIADYAAVMRRDSRRLRDALASVAARWIAAAILISFAASGLQMTAIRIGPLNHNDVHHAVDLVALYCFYRGGMVLSASPPRTRPR